MHAYLCKTCSGKTSWDITSKPSAYGLDKKAKNRYIEKMSWDPLVFKPIPRPIQGECFEEFPPMENLNLVIQMAQLKARKGLEAYNLFEPVLEPDFEVVILAEMQEAVGSLALNDQGN